ncbi:hypothetical protein [Olsenella urininfantis]|uniref:hypothetical protein n=1 Tax=Olsenella urininfantis TaxID=1871033 RepID=UPI00098417AB|nr:hypothetical protein [Olsenella urininfantis]
MPSWNIHLAQAEAALREAAASDLGIEDENAFLFGNLVPDVYVGYMVLPLPYRIGYCETHFADPGHVPEPRYWEFWGHFGLPSADEHGRVSDVVLGAWCHLLADNVYNHNVNVFRQAHGIPRGEETRIRKQADFELFGRTLELSRTCHETEWLKEEALAFPQYGIYPDELRLSIQVANQMVLDNQLGRPQGRPSYSMLTAELFDQTFDEVLSRMVAGLKAYAREGASAPELREERPHA